MPDQPNHQFNIEKFKKILLCYAILLAAAAIYFDFISRQKLPHLGIINFTFSVLNFTVIGILLYHWEKVRKWNMEIEQAEAESENVPSHG
jgi:hypothetical protein